MRTLALLLLLAGVPAASVGAEREPIDPGLYAMVDDGGELTGKVMRVTRKSTDWQFEDRQPDGSWLDVSCHGGCAHPEAPPEVVAELFGSAPPPEIRVSCVYNAEYAFCRAIRDQRDAYSLVVRVPTESGRLVVSMVRSPESGDAPAAPGGEFF